MARNKYEWMLDDTTSADAPRSARALPLDPDATLAPLFAIAPVLPLLAAGLVLAYRRRQWGLALALTVLLLLGWLGKFFLLRPSC